MMSFPHDRIKHEVRRLLAQLLPPEMTLEAVRNGFGNVTTVIGKAMREILPHPFKIVVHASLIENANQGLVLGTAFLWDEERDGLVAEVYDACKAVTVTIVVMGALME